MRNTDQATPVPVRLGRPELAVVILVVLEAVSLLVYFTVRGAIVTSLSNVAIPFLWINLGVWGALRVGWPRRGRRTAAAFVSIGYVAVLFVAAGVVSGGGHHGGVSVYWLLPGWGPIVALQSEPLAVWIVPYQVVGYLSLGYIVFVTVARTASGALAGVLGVFSCIGCTLPVLTTIFGGVGGTAAATIAGTGTASMLGTAAYGATVLLLVFTERLATGH